MASNLVNLWLNAGGSSPDGWDFVTLDSLLLNSKSMSVGVMYPGKHFEKGVPLIKVSDVKNGEIASKPDFCISESVDNEYKRTRLKGEELLITLVGNPGDCVIVTDDMIGWNAARALAVLTLKDPSIRHWLRIVLLSSPSKHIIDSRLNTTVQKTLNLKDIRELPIPLPSKKIREQLCSIDSAFEQKCLLNRQTNQTLEQMAQALFKSWFVDFDPVFDNALASGMAVNDFPEALQKRALSRQQQRIQMQQQIANEEPLAHKKPSAAKQAEAKPLPQDIRQLFPSEFEQTDEPSIGINGWIPRGWSIQPAEKVASIAIGKTPPRKQQEWFSDVKQGNVVWSSIKNMAGESAFINDSSEYLTPESIDKFNVKVVPKGSVILSFKLTLGRVAITSCDLATNEAIAHFVDPKLGLNKEYVYCYLKQFNYGSLGSTSSIATAVNSKIIKKMPFLAPHESITQNFRMSVGSIFSKMEAIQNNSLKLEEIRDTLLPKLISGELTLPADHSKTTATTEAYPS